MSCWIYSGWVSWQPLPCCILTPLSSFGRISWIKTGWLSSNLPTLTVFILKTMGIPYCHALASSRVRSLPCWPIYRVMPIKRCYGKISSSMTIGRWVYWRTCNKICSHLKKPIPPPKFKICWPWPRKRLMMLSHRHVSNWWRCKMPDLAITQPWWHSSIS